LDVVHHLSRRIIVLYRGRIMEQGDAGAVYNRPSHPYTQALLNAAPRPDPEIQRSRRAARSAYLGDDRGVGRNACPFAPRCPYALDICRTERPALDVTPSGTLIACHRWRELRSEHGAEVREASTTAAVEREPRVTGLSTLSE